MSNTEIIAFAVFMFLVSSGAGVFIGLMMTGRPFYECRNALLIVPTGMFLMSAYVFGVGLLTRWILGGPK